MVEALTLTKSSLFWVIFRVHRHSHLNSALCFHQPPPLSLKHKAKHSTPLCHLLWPGDSLPSYKAASAQSCFLITAQLLHKPSFTVCCFPGWKKCLPAHHKSQSAGVFHCPIPSPEEAATFSQPTKLHQLAAKKTMLETHERCSLVTRELAAPEDSWCPEKSVSFMSSAEQAEECLSRRGIMRSGC